MVNSNPIDARLFHSVMAAFAPLDDDNFEAFHELVISLVQNNPSAVGSLAAEALDDDDDRTRAAAAYILGRAGEIGDDELVEASEPRLLAMIERETDARAIEMMCAALGHIWARAFGKDRIIELARHSNRNIRLAAAEALALSSAAPLSSEEQAALDALGRDPDPDILRWVTFALETTSQGD